MKEPFAKSFTKILEEIAWSHGIIRDTLNGRKVTIPRCDHYPYQTFEKAVWLEDVKKVLKEGLVAKFQKRLEQINKRYVDKKSKDMAKLDLLDEVLEALGE